MNSAVPYPLLVADVVLTLAAALSCANAVALDVPSHFAGAAVAATEMSALPGSAQRAQSRTAPAYDSISVAQPANDSTVFDNAGDVEVMLAVSPHLRSGAGDRIALILDGRQMSVRGATRFKLSEITRGAHTVEAQILDRSGNTLIASNPVRFYLWQASRLFPARGGR